jgi:hypothetical protein
LIFGFPQFTRSDHHRPVKVQAKCHLVLTVGDANLRLKTPVVLELGGYQRSVEGDVFQLVNVLGEKKKLLYESLTNFLYLLEGTTFDGWVEGGQCRKNRHKHKTTNIRNDKWVRSDTAILRYATLGWRIGVL